MSHLVSLGPAAAAPHRAESDATSPKAAWPTSEVVRNCRRPSCRRRTTPPAEDPYPDHDDPLSEGNGSDDARANETAITHPPSRAAPGPGQGDALPTSI